MMFLEAQFGAENVSPVADPKPSSLPPPPPKKEKKEKREKKPSAGTGEGGESDASMDVSSEEESEEEEEQDEETKARELKERQQMELARLHRLGIPVPGLAIKVDKMEAIVWLEDLEIECSNRVFSDRVRAVVERAAEVTAPLWG